MEFFTKGGVVLANALARFVERAGYDLPNIAGTFLLPLTGWVLLLLLIRWLRALAMRAAVVVDRLLARLTRTLGSAQRGKLPTSSARVLGSLVFWLVLREISLRHWPKVVYKEVSIGVFSFLGIATLLSGMLVVT